MTLDTECRTLIERFPLGFVASLGADGAPRVSPKGTFVVLGQEAIAFSDIRSPGTVANLRRDPRVEINFADPFARKAVRVRGTARLTAREDDAFAELIGRWETAWPDLAARIRHLVIITVEAASLITTPPYDDGATEQDMIALYKAKFAEIYP